ncbi:MAG: PDGLE domain-containing protein [Nitrospirota bacterium]|jgi:hypothetical protein
MRNVKFKKLLIGIIILIVLTPIGLILPEKFKSGGAWGEWSADEIEKILGYVPEGLKRLSKLWSSPITDYTFSGWESGVKGYIGYILSGIIGIALVIGISFLIGKFLVRKNGNT